MQLLVVLLSGLALSVHGFSAPSTCRLTLIGTSSQRSKTALAASSTSGEERKELFKAGLLANVEEEAASLASKKIRSVQDLGWSGPAKRKGNTRPRHWAFGGAGEKAIQNKPNYDPESPMCVEKWLSLQQFYAIIKDDTAVADTIFVALAKGGAYVERDVAEEVISRWRAGSPGGKVRRQRASPFDNDAFLKTVQEGRRDFLLGWAAFVTLTGVSVAGIVFPTNPLQLALVDFLELLTHTDARMAEQAALQAASLL